MLEIEKQELEDIVENELMTDDAEPSISTERENPELGYIKLEMKDITKPIENFPIIENAAGQGLPAQNKIYVLDDSPEFKMGRDKDLVDEPIDITQSDI